MIAVETFFAVTRAQRHVLSIMSAPGSVKLHADKAALINPVVKDVQPLVRHVWNLALGHALIFSVQCLAGR